MTNILTSRGILKAPFMVEALKNTITKDMSVCVLLFSFFDKHIKDQEAYDLYYKPGGEYHTKMLDSFAPYGIQSNQIEFVYYFDDTKQSALKKIKDADIIYFPGGAPEKMMARIKAFDIKEALEDKTKIYIGSSAGAMIQFSTFHISPDFDYPIFSINEGLNLIEDFIVEVHYRRRKKQKSAMRHMHRSTHKPIYSIPDDGALIVNEGHVKTLGSAKQLYDHKGWMR